MRFEYFGQQFEGFDHPYNTTLANERAVEIPIALDWLRSRKGEGLEVGNVLGHYGVHGHRVVDLHEQAPGVENIDVADVDGRYDWIVSISTLEHVGYDTIAVDEHASIAALGHLRGLLAAGGHMLITVPGGSHLGLDAYLASTAGASRCATLVRSGGTWIQSAALQFLPYRFSTNWAESVFIGEWRAP